MGERITLIVRRMLLVSTVFAISGCALKPADSFNLEVDLPANFRFRGDAVYRPATGETCTLPKRRGKRPEFKVFDTAGKPVANRVSFDVPLTEQVNGCPLVLGSITFDIYGKWGEHWSAVGGDYAYIHVLDRLESDMPAMPASGVQELAAQCQWLFRTLGPLHAIRKIMKCNSLDASGQLRMGRAGGVVQREPLRGRTLRMALGLTDQEQPAVDDNWVAVPGG
ncbi:hypothetical protein [Pseudomonas sp. ANT_H4]|uniref:hypothetical protein n=1 Tax=unclassified Pseudomonas TaxID=196821 RepID=UPI0035325AA0